MPANSPLRQLARRMGILDGYRDQGGTQRRTTDGTRVALLAAMGIDAATPGRAREALAEARRAAREAKPAGGLDLPARCPDVADALRGHRVWGITANLYSVASARNWGIGNTGDLARLVEWTAAQGGAFVGVNPLHAIRNTGHEISPYGPLSRLYRNPLYLDVTHVPEWLEEPDLTDERRARALRGTPQVEYERVRTLVLPVLERLHARFVAGAPAARRAAYDAYRAREGAVLDEYATFCAIEEYLGAQHIAPTWWGAWPDALRDPRSGAVRELGAKLAARVDFHRWIQFELDRQLEQVAAHARARGMPVGLYQDLAIGTPGGAADVWSRQHLFARGVSIGAPPDPYTATGQVWGLVPLNPHRLVADDRFEYWALLVRSAMRHAGALRIDHVLGLFRQFWIPDGGTGKDGAYVRFPREAMLGVLAREAHAARAIVVGEDLGTVPPEVPPALERWGILSSKVMYFERDSRRGYRPARSYPRMALATVNTHDHAPLAGFRAGGDIEVRAALGTLPPRAAAAARRERARERAEMLAMLREEGLLDPAREPDTRELTIAVHAWLRRTPCWMVGLSLDDLAGEETQVNVPGVAVERHRSWSRRMRAPLETLLADRDTILRLGEERRWEPPA